MPESTHSSSSSSSAGPSRAVARQGAVRSPPSLLSSSSRKLSLALVPFLLLVLPSLLFLNLPLWQAPALPSLPFQAHTEERRADAASREEAMAAIATASAALSGMDSAKFVSRKVVRKLLSQEQDEGDGARVRRSIGRPEMKSLDPFLLLDEFRAGPPAGFPDHPHRGFETVTYMLQGRFCHEDFDGHKGTIGPGDLQWMTAGRGIMHAEMPMNVGVSHGLQLWVNLGSKDKMIPSSYQELLDKDVPKVEKDGVHVAVIAGESMGVTSPVYTRTPTMYLSFRMQPGSHLRQAIPEGWNAFVYTLSGAPTFGEEGTEPAEAHHTLQLGEGQGLEVWNRGQGEAAFVLIAGQPLGEPVVQYGPFVMNTREEIMATLRDLQLGQNGFEKARGWRSSIRDGVS